MLTLLSAGPSKLSAQICFHGGVWSDEFDPDEFDPDEFDPDELDAAEQPRLASTINTLNPAASRRNCCEAPVRSPAPSARRLPSAG